ncbi:MAG: efflux RND transporter periplasmic adaptor subunit [Gemmatimonadota bacterium]|nr:MAG: efflux RND transporter periplasmic adaptor subunit [Gemmatimonadota bacterium]
MSKKKKILIGIGVVVVVGFFVVFNLMKSTEKGLNVQAKKVKRGDLTAKVAATGRIQPAKKVDISANVSARIISLAVKEGDWVEEGQLLVQLDRTLYKARVEGAQASLNSFKAQARLNKANLDQAELEYNRQKELFEKRLTSQELLDASKTNLEVQKARYESAKQQVAQAQASLEQAEDDLSKTTITAPMAGIVTQLNSEVGEVVLGTSMASGTIIMTISDLSEMEVEVEVDESDVVDVDLGQLVEIEVDALPDTVLRGQVKEIANTAFTRYAGTAEEVTNFMVTIGVLDNVPQLKPGMSATVDITTATHEDVLQVPIQCVVMREPKIPKEEKDSSLVAEAEASEVEPSERDEEGGADAEDEEEEKEPIEMVFVVVDGEAHMRPVKTGIIGDLDIEIVEGLEDGEMVVTGSYKVLSKVLKDGQKVKVEKKKKGKAQR